MQEAYGRPAAAKRLSINGSCRLRFGELTIFTHFYPIQVQHCRCTFNQLVALRTPIYTKLDMMPSHPVTHALYAVGYIGNPTSDSARMKTLAGAGPLLLAQEHMLVVMLPEAFDRTSQAPKVVVNLTDLHSLLFGGLLFDGDLVDKGAHLAVRAARLAKLFKDAAEAGMPMGPIAGTLEQAWLILKSRFFNAILSLSAADRTIAHADAMTAPRLL